MVDRWCRTFGGRLALAEKERARRAGPLTPQVMSTGATQTQQIKTVALFDNPNGPVAPGVQAALSSGVATIHAAIGNPTSTASASDHAMGMINANPVTPGSAVGATGSTAQVAVRTFTPFSTPGGNQSARVF